ncbi:MAG: CPBP family intramembrane metalloprotease [Prolixibacteraceae bacterium]|nr:CPBP family intramembrane metalloprotease [Prolixibacteraceae bacterium]
MTEHKFKNYPTIAQSFGIAGIVILGMIFLTPVSFILNNLLGKEASMLIYYVLAVGVPFWIVFSIRKRKTGEQKFNFSVGKFRFIPVVIVATLALLFGIISPINDLIPMSDYIKKIFLDLGSMKGVSAFLMLVVSAPILEELIFRGIVLDGLLKKYSPVKSILLSAFLFGFIHLNPWQFVTGFFAGIFMGWIYYKTTSLSLTMIIHATANLAGYIMKYFFDHEKAINLTSKDIYGGTTNLILIIIGSVIIISLCVYYISNECKKETVISEYIQ